MKTSRLAPGLFLLTLLAACSPGFDEPWEVKDLRLLGAAVTPPEFVYELTPPTEALEVKLDFLWADPEAPTLARAFRVESCGLYEEVLCPEETRLILAEGNAAPGLSSVDLTIPADLIKASFEAEPYGGLFGAAVWLQIRVADGEGGFVTMLKSVLVSPSAGFAKTPNNNPVVEAVVLVADDETRTAVPLDDEGLWQLAPDSEQRILAVLPDSSREDYIVPALDTSISEVAGGEAPEIVAQELSEDLSYKFYTDNGSLSVDEKTERDIPVIDQPGAGRLRDQSVTFTAPTEGSGTVWMVITDGRGGTAFVVLPFAVSL